jgi:hypothetical protein
MPKSSVSVILLSDETKEFVKANDDEAVSNAFEMGVMVINRVKATSDTDFISKQAEGILATVEVATVKLAASYREIMREIFEAEIDLTNPKSILAKSHSALSDERRAMQETFANISNIFRDDLRMLQASVSDGDMGVTGKLKRSIQEVDVFIKKHLDGTNTEGQVYKIGKLIEGVSEHLDQTVKNSVSESVRKEVEKINERITQLREAIAMKDGVDQIMDKASIKGVAFEEELFSRIAPIAAVLGDKCEMSGTKKEISASKKGDILYTTGDGHLIVIECKDKAIAQKPSLDYMKLAISDRGGKVGILVSKNPDLHAQQIGRWNAYDNIIICTADDIEMTLKVARIIIASEKVETKGVDATLIKNSVIKAELEMKKFVTVRTTLTNMRKAVGDGCDRIETSAKEMEEGIQNCLDAIFDEMKRVGKKEAKP